MRAYPVAGTNKKGIFVMRGLNGGIVGVVPPSNGEFYTEYEYDELFNKGYSFIFS